VGGNGLELLHSERGDQKRLSVGRKAEERG
jgi:hypothetical protein